MSSTLRGFLADHDVAQVDLAAYLHMSQQAVSDRIRGRTQWRLHELLALADLLGLTLDELVPLALAAASRYQQAA